jgi:hypothetical protein
MGDRRMSQWPFRETRGIVTFEPRHGLPPQTAWTALGFLEEKFEGGYGLTVDQSVSSRTLTGGAQ